MNQPEYILTEVFAEVVSQAKAALGWEVLRYDYGTREEMNETLVQYAQTEEFRTKKYPLVWLREPFTLTMNATQGYYADVNNVGLFIITGSLKDYKAEERTEIIFKPILFPILRQLVEQLNNHAAIGYEYVRKYTVTKRPYWGQMQQSEIVDVVDVIDISDLTLKINHNKNC